MIFGLTHPGSGIGNQLHRYVATRVLALDKGYDFSMVAPENSKVRSFMSLDMGFQFSDGVRIVDYETEMPAGKIVHKGGIFKLWEEKTPYYNPEFNFVEDNTIIDGEFQDERYFGHRLHEINKWLKVEPIQMSHDICVIGFRGGEFKLFPDLFLTQDYWEKAIGMMLDINPDMRFEVHTDDLETAKAYFAGLKNLLAVWHDPELNWKSVRYAKYLIIPNSSFYILPALLNGHARKVIAPRYWGRRNTKEWNMPQNFYKKFTYI